MRDEHLYQQIVDQEREDDYRYRQNLAGKELAKFTPKAVDTKAAMERFEKDFAPVFAARRKVGRSKVFREKMRLSGDLKDMELNPKEIVDPDRGIVTVGPTAEQIVKQIAKNPKAYRHLMKKGPKVHHVGAQRREIEPKLANEPRDDS